MKLHTRVLIIACIFIGSCNSEKKENETVTQEVDTVGRVIDTTTNVVKESEDSVTIEKSDKVIKVQFNKAEPASRVVGLDSLAVANILNTEFSFVLREKNVIEGITSCYTDVKIEEVSDFAVLLSEIRALKKIGSKTSDVKAIYFTHCKSPLFKIYVVDNKKYFAILDGYLFY